MPDVEPSSLEVQGERFRVVTTTGARAGTTFTRWQSVSITRALDQASTRFVLGVAGAIGLEVRPQDGLQLFLDDELVTQGYVDELEASLGRAERRIRVAGRDFVADLVDSSADVEPGSWTNATLAQIVADLLAPYGLPFRFVAPQGDPFPNFELQRGESPWTAIERAARARGLLVYPEATGALRITKPGEADAGVDLVQGGRGSNVLAARLRVRSQDRFNLYRVKAQRRGDADAWGEAVAHVEGVARDQGVDRYRPLVLVAEQQATPADAQARAEWESAYRVARSLELQVTVQDWYRPGGAIWKLNELVNIRSRQLGIEARMLIDGLTFRRDPDAEGTTTVLRLVRQDAYLQEPNREDDSSELLEKWLAPSTPGGGA